RHENLILAEAEKGGFNGNWQLDQRSLGAHRIFELPFAVFGGVDAKIARRVVTFARSDTSPGDAVHLYFESAPAAVARCVRAVIAHQVVAGGVGLHALESITKVAQIKKSAPTGVGCQC